jgi:hypothetical protein
MYPKGGVVWFKPHANHPVCFAATPPWKGGENFFRSPGLKQERISNHFSSPLTVQGVVVYAGGGVSRRGGLTALHCIAEADPPPRLLRRHPSWEEERKDSARFNYHWRNRRAVSYLPSLDKEGWRRKPPGWFARAFTVSLNQTHHPASFGGTPARERRGEKRSRVFSCVGAAKPLLLDIIFPSLDKEGWRRKPTGWFERALLNHRSRHTTPPPSEAPLLVR